MAAVAPKQWVPIRVILEYDDPWLEFGGGGEKNADGGEVEDKVRGYTVWADYNMIGVPLESNGNKSTFL